MEAPLYPAPPMPAQTLPHLFRGIQPLTQYYCLSPPAMGNMCHAGTHVEHIYWPSSFEFS